MGSTKKSIVFISHSRLNKVIMNDYAIDKMLEKHNLQYWDLSQVVRPCDYEVIDEVTGDYIKVVDDIAEFELMLNRLDDSTILITDLNHNYIFRAIFKLLKKYTFTLIHLDLVTIGPYWAAKKTFYSRLRNLFRDPIRYLRLIATMVYMAYLGKTGKLRNFDYQFSRGEKNHKSEKNIANKSIAINSPDYDSFLKQLSEPIQYSVGESEYAVFLDVYLPYHADHAVIGVPYLKDPNSYFTSMNTLFTAVEKKYAVKVIIAAHPSAGYHGGEFEGRQIIQGKTNRLVKSSKFVISHFSNSMSYAVLYGKPCLFCYTDEMFELYHHSLLHHQNCYAAYLGASTYNISELLKEELPDLSQFHSSLHYQSFIDDFLTSEASKDRQSSDIIISFIDSISSD
jgi:hypothetical protein